MKASAGIAGNTLGTITGLVVSIGFIFLGLDFGFPFGTADPFRLALTLWGWRHTLITILALLLIPLCSLEKKWALSAAFTLGITTAALCLIDAAYMVVVTPPGFESQIAGPIIWAIIQIPIIVFSYRAQGELLKARTKE